MTKRQKIAAPQAAEPYEHPEDRAVREAGEAFSKTPEAGLLAAIVGTAKTDPQHANAYRLYDLLQTYSDGDAHDLLDKLREEFWSHEAIKRDVAVKP